MGSVAEMRLRGVGALAGDGDLDIGHRRHDRAIAPGEGAGRHLRPVVHPEHHLHLAALEQAFPDHDVAAREVLLRRLEDDVDRAVEIAGLGQVLCRAKQHGGVAVMAAGMHDACVLRGIGRAGLLQDRQRVHVGAQADRALRRAVPADHADHAGARQAGDDLVDAERRSASSCTTPLVRVSCSASSGCACRSCRHSRHLAVEFGDAVDDRHWSAPVGEGAREAFVQVTSV